MIHGVRKKHSIKVRRPLKQVLIPELDALNVAASRALEDIILQETNVKLLATLPADSDLIHKSGKLNFKKLGKTLGPDIQKYAEAVKALDTHQIRNLESMGELEVAIANGSHVFTLEDIEIVAEDIPGWIIAKEGRTTIAIDLEQDEALMKEGFAREFVNRIQNLRKDLNFDVQDKITIAVSGDISELSKAALITFDTYIRQEVQAIALQIGGTPVAETAQIIEVDEENLLVALSLSN
jgi:isoleucyl-tRNA synthetase